MGTVTATRRGPLVLLERIALAAASTLVSISVCTGLPLLAVWIGSRAASGNVFSWIGIITAVVASVLAALRNCADPAERPLQQGHRAPAANPPAQAVGDQHECRAGRTRAGAT